MTLRELAAGDAPDLFQLTDRGRSQLRHWLPWVDAVRSVSHSLAFIRSQRALRQRRAAQTWGIFEMGRLVGVISAHPLSWANRGACLGYWLGARFEGRGLMTRSVKALMGYLFDYLGFHRISIHCAASNYRSRAIPERLGFREEGLLHGVQRLNEHFIDHVVYAKVVRA